MSKYKVPTNWYMRVTPGLSERVQEILFSKCYTWKDGSREVGELTSEWLVLTDGVIYISNDAPKYCEQGVEEIDAFSFVASNGELKILPKYCQTILVRDNSNDSWIEEKFSNYIPDSSTPIACLEGDYKEFRFIEDSSIDFAEFLDSKGILSDFLRNFRIENQRWSELSMYKSSLKELEELPPSRYIFDAFRFKESTVPEILEINDEWVGLSKTHDCVTFDKNGLFDCVV